MEFTYALLAATVFHELGHLVVISTLGLNVKRVGLSPLGIYLVHTCGNSYMNLAVLLGGVLANMLLLLVSLKLHLGMLAIANFALILVNILPIPMSDGWKILKILYICIDNRIRYVL